ncbi:hypothetical protein CcCBS67573_g07977 [Chytriomyces confervae]|uniref:Uncharacterized protein n=1 Tax=Chytriomyces confervae TaxID=246404 RepID=A0A507EPA6_9FUNG|nr:hypothetical protein CcCBS67573_g07977 [Chytriomyces confervae]
MEHFTNWCLICERKLEHDGIYCSIKCLKTDFISSTRAEYGPVGTVHEQKLHRDLTRLGVFTDLVELKRSCTVQRNLNQRGSEHEWAQPHEKDCPPSPTPSASSMSSSISSSSSAFSSISSEEASEFCPTRAFLSPAFSLQIKSRRRRTH